MLRLRAFLWLLPCTLSAETLRIAPFAQEVHIRHRTGDTRSVAADAGKVWAAGVDGLQVYDGAAWTKLPGMASADQVAAGNGIVWFTSGNILWRLQGDSPARVAELPASATHLAARGRVLISTRQGLFVYEDCSSTRGGASLRRTVLRRSIAISAMPRSRAMGGWRLRARLGYT
jgi:hypothetical protein